MKRFFAAAGLAAVCMGSGASVTAQTNGLDPANLPPAGFEGREFTDNAGCAFLRSTFGGKVTWVPRYGPDRNPVCGQTPTNFATVAAPQSAPAEQAEAPVASAPAASPTPPAATATVQTAQPKAEPQRGRIEVVGAVADPVRRPAPSYLGKEPKGASVAPRRAAPPVQRKPRLPQADASGRHMSCPESAPYGQLVDTLQGRKMVRCVTSPALFLDDYVEKQVATAHAPRGTMRHGTRVQVGSFAVPGNAQRLLARLSASGLPARSHRAAGLNVVTVGPFADGASARAALSQVRGMGFGDAFLR